MGAACGNLCNVQEEKKNELTLLDELFSNNNPGQTNPVRKESVNKSNGGGAGNDDFLLFFEDAPTYNQNGDP